MVKISNCPTCGGTKEKQLYGGTHGTIPAGKAPCTRCDPGDGPTGRIAVLSDGELKAVSLYFTGEWPNTGRKEGLDTIDKLFVDIECEISHRSKEKGEGE